MLYPLSYEGGECIGAGQRVLADAAYDGVLGLRALGVPDRRVSNGLLNRASRDASVLVSALRD